MSLAELLRKTVLGAALAFSSGYVAGCTKPNFRESRVVAEQGLTNQQGEVSFSNQVVAQVQDGTAQLPLENMVVHYLHAGSENTLLAIDPQGNYYPNLASFASGETTERRRRKPRKIIIELDQFQEGMEAGQAIVDAFTYQGGDILGEDENYFKYCLSMEDILTSTIDIPAGIILIAPKLVYGEITEFVASAGTALLKDIVNTFIVAEYGQQPGYEVHSPKRAMSICGEEYEDIICDISGDKLKQIWDPDLPYWHIVGGCAPNGGEMTDPCAPQEGLVFCDDFSGTELDGGKWGYFFANSEDNKNYLTQNNGILEMRVPGTDILLVDGHSFYVLGESTFIFEARWKVREREGTTFNVGTYDYPINEHAAVGFSFGYDYGNYDEEGKLLCLARQLENNELRPCDEDITTYNVTKFVMTKDKIDFYINSLMRTSIATKTQKDLKFYVRLGCGSSDQTEKACSVDYVKLIVK